MNPIETGILSIVLIATIAALAVSMPPAIDANMKQLATPHNTYGQYRDFTDANNGKHIHLARE